MKFSYIFILKMPWQLLALHGLNAPHLHSADGVAVGINRIEAKPILHVVSRLHTGDVGSTLMFFSILQNSLYRVFKFAECALHIRIV